MEAQENVKNAVFLNSRWEKMALSHRTEIQNPSELTESFATEVIQLSSPL